MSLDVVLYHSGHEWSEPWLRAFEQGLHRHGLMPENLPHQDIRPSDLAVIWAHRQQPLFETQRKYGGHYLILERGHVGDRSAWTSARFDGLNGRGWCPPAVDGGARWRRFFNAPKPWRRGGDYALIMGQVPGDASVKGVDLPAWYRRVATEARALGLPVRFRNHPHLIGLGGQLFVELALADGPLIDALAGAAVAITWNSNSGVDAVLAGVPVVAMDQGSMAWRVAAHAVGEFERPPRGPWAADLAWSQWQMAEMASGSAWEHLRSGLA